MTLAELPDYGAREKLEHELAGVVAALNPALEVLEELRAKRDGMIRDLLELEEAIRPSFSEVASIAGVSRQIVARVAGAGS